MANSDVEAQEGRAKKRARTIINLTEEQLQHKRNVDRKAQRAFRQRTKDSIYRLEQQIADLQKTAGEREARFQNELSTLRGSNSTLLQCLEHISELASATARSMANAMNNDVDSAQRYIDRPSFEPAQLFGSAGASASQDNLHAASSANVPHLIPDSTARPVATTVQPDVESPLATRPVDTSPVHQRPASMHPNHLSPQQLRDGTPEIPISCLLDRSGGPQNLSPAIPASARTGYPSPSASHPPANPGSEVTHSPHSEYHVAHSVNDNYQPDMVLSPLTSDRAAISETVYKACSSSDLNSVFTVLPSHSSPTCPLDDILHNFLRSRREMIARGVPIDTVVGPAKPTVKALLNPSMASTVHPICGVMSEVLSTFPHVSKPEKLAFFYVMFNTMRWQISPTKESYTAMPPWLRPTVTQITVRHAPWIDNIPWPGVRDAIIEKPDEHSFEVFSQYYSENVRINWTFDSLDAVSDSDNEVVLHSIFEKHVCNLKNWTVLPEFLRRFPAMTSAIYSRD